MPPLISVKGGTLTAHYRHEDELETCLDYRVRQRLETDLVAEVDLTTRLASRVGTEHEASVIATLGLVPNGIHVIGAQEDDRGKQKQIELTLQAMRQGQHLISGGFLSMGPDVEKLAEGIRKRWKLHSVPHFWGEPDLLRRVDDSGCPSAFGSWHYEVADIKSARTAKPPAKLQVAFYSWLLAEIQGHLPVRGHVIPRPPGGGEPPWETFTLSEILPIAELFVREDYWRIVTADPHDLVSKRGFQEPYSSAWAEREGLLGDNLPACDVAALPGMRLPARRGLYRAGIRTVRDLAAAPAKAIDAAAGPGATRHGIAKLQVQAQVCVGGRPRWRDAASTDLNAVVAALGTTDEGGDPPAGMSDRGAVVTHFDMESDPFAGVEYLFGYSVHPPGGTASKPCFIWAPSADAQGEAAAFTAFLDAMEDLQRRHGRVLIVHYSHYEPTHLRQLADRHPGSTEQPNGPRVEALCRRMLDTYKVITSSLLLPFTGYSIKQVAPGLETLPAPGGPGTAHHWLVIPTIDVCIERLARLGASPEEQVAARRELEAAKAELELEDDTDLLSASAAMSIVWHDRWRSSGAPIWKHLVEWYNGDDLNASDAVYRWLTAIADGQTDGIDPAGLRDAESSS